MRHRPLRLAYFPPVGCILLSVMVAMQVVGISFRVSLTCATFAA